MKYLLFIFLLFPGIVLSQVTVDKPVFCARASIVLEMLQKTYNEEPIWAGEDSQSKYALFVNSERNGQFTIVQFNHEMACILGLGPSSFSVNQKPTL